MAGKTSQPGVGGVVGRRGIYARRRRGVRGSRDRRRGRTITGVLNRQSPDRKLARTTRHSAVRAVRPGRSRYGYLLMGRGNAAFMLVPTSFPGGKKQSFMRTTHGTRSARDRARASSRSNRWKGL